MIYKINNIANLSLFIILVALYVMESVSHINYSAITEYYKLLPLACIFQSNETDEELENVSLSLLAMLSHTLTLKHHIPGALEAIQNVTRCPFWSARAAIAEFISVFVFHNMATLISKPEWVAQVKYKQKSGYPN